MKVYLHLATFKSEETARLHLRVLRATGDTPQQWPIEYPGGWLVLRMPAHQSAPRRLVARMLARWRSARA